MTKTIRELAKELEVSKQTIQYHYQRLSPANQQKDTNGRNVINQQTEKIIRNKVTKSLSANNATKPGKGDKENNNKSSNVNAVLTAQIEDLKKERDKQLATKDRQIASKDRQIDNLTKLLDQSQQLQLMAEKKLQELQKIEQPQQENKKNDTNDLDKQNDTDTTSKRWWQFWK